MFGHMPVGDHSGARARAFEAWVEIAVARRRQVNSVVADLLVSNAGVGGADVSFSADTDMGECLLVGRKGGSSKRATFVTLNERPDSKIAGSAIANRIQHTMTHTKLRRLEDGPSGGTPVLLGSEMVGQAIDAPINGGWSLARVRDFSLAQSAYQLARGRLWLPGTRTSDVSEIQISTIGKIGKIGPYHADINGRTSDGGIRGPFDKHPLQSKSASTYPLLWEHDAEREYALAFEADCEAVPVSGKNKIEQHLINEKIESVWATASHSHFNVNFRFK